MRKIAGLILLLTLTGCSYDTNFYIFNTTDKPITVTYESRPNRRAFVPEPIIVGFDSNFDTLKIKRFDAYKTEYSPDSNTNVITCELESGQALWIGNQTNFTLSNPDEARILKEHLVSLKVEQEGIELFRVSDRYVIDFFESIDLHKVGIKVK